MGALLISALSSGQLRPCNSKLFRRQNGLRFANFDPRQESHDAISRGTGSYHTKSHLHLCPYDVGVGRAPAFKELHPLSIRHSSFSSIGDESRGFSLVRFIS